ncbi:hypothetical protein ABE525_03130 [Pseudomonas wadenswilerensis]|uniref:hypothetical protein n=1 Tax=Pseudomonas wadenswilerensis TaxID=1785161 RepID=UPI00320B9C15
MPTENRSSNTEQMVSVPRELAQRIQSRLDHTAIAFKAAKPERDELRNLLAQPAAQHQGEPILIQAVAVTRQDDDEGLRLEWLLEGGISELEFAGKVLFAMPEANDLCDEDGSAEVFLHPTICAAYSRCAT